MTRISEKVRDIVDVRPYTTVDDLFREPETTLANYHFTDITAYMMARWFDAVASGEPSQISRAIAGFRGVGKSHFLAVFAVLMSHPELRSRLTDQHVQSATQRLLRRHYPVINVRRGTGTSLSEELYVAAAAAFDLDGYKIGSTVQELMSSIAGSSGGLTPIIVIDSSPERSGPIERNDGDALAEIADACRSASIFVGIALDDEIAMADGTNSAIAKSYNIEYLDPENLHKVVNAHIFPKNPRTQVILGSLYETFRSSIPDFKWSEQRFSSLYPLHPVLLELTPFIRSYLPKFALFSFASSAGEKIKGRPADSLIGIDDVFDAVEFDLRKVPELQSVFKTYDAASAQIGVNVPVAARHKSKLVLKVLLLNSLAQRASSGSDVAATMMIADDGEPGNSIRDIDSMLGGYAAAFPNAIFVDVTDADCLRYRFNVGTDEFEKKLNLLIDTASPSIADRAIAEAITERFPELSDLLSKEVDAALLFTEWRGSRRRGRIYFSNFLKSEENRASGQFDWEVCLGFAGGDRDFSAPESAGTLLEWKTAAISETERRTFIALTALRAENELRSKYPEKVSALMLSLSDSVKAAVERVMINDARLVIDGFDYNFSDAARSASTLSGMLGEMLEPLFEALYPEHPYFVETLTPETVDGFVRSLTDTENSDQSALTFGVALAVGEFTESGFAILQKEQLQEAQFVVSVLNALKDPGNGEVIELPKIQTLLAQAPVGLAAEAAHLILTAMAYRGLIELITIDHERVRGRAIDLKLDWSKILAIASARTTTASQAELLKWAKIVCADDSITSLEAPEDKTKILDAFMEIAAQWERRNPFEVFEQISDSEINTSIWRHSNKSWDNYIELVGSINEAVVGNASVDECLDRICRSFGAQVEAFERSRGSVVAIEDFVKANAEINRVSNYLSLAEMTDNAEIESARCELRESLTQAGHLPSDRQYREIGYRWEKFLRLYTEFYVDLHRSFIESCCQRNISDRASTANGFDRRKTRAIRRKVAVLKCNVDPTAFLHAAPYCKCGFQPSEISIIDELTPDVAVINADPQLLHSEADLVI